MMQRVAHFLQKEPTIWGPISLLCTLAIGATSSIPFDLLFIAVVGLFLSARLQLRGCCYSLVFLGIAAAVKHAFFITDHLWQLGLEGSLACAFFMTALAFEQGAAWIESLESQMQTRKLSLENLEEELSKVQQTAQEQQIALQEKMVVLQKELEDLQAEHSSILILNEVLRKTTARHIQENEILTADRGQEELRRGEHEECRAELRRVMNIEPLFKQLKKQFEEKNQVLHQTRSELFKSDTELQRLKMERAAIDLKEIPKEVEGELQWLGAQVSALEEEAQQLQELVSVLSETPKN